MSFIWKTLFSDRESISNDIINVHIYFKNLCRIKRVHRFRLNSSTQHERRLGYINESKRKVNQLCDLLLATQTEEWLAYESEQTVNEWVDTWRHDWCHPNRPVRLLVVHCPVVHVPTVHVRLFHYVCHRSSWHLRCSSMASVLRYEARDRTIFN